MNLQSVLGSARKKFLTPRSSRPARTARIRVEQLEAREVPATLPAPQIDEVTKRNLGDGFAPMTVIDPTNDQHIVTVNAAFDTNIPPHRAVAGRSSIDGGRSWRQFSIGTEVVIDPKTNTPFLNRGAPTVAFDRFNNFFVAFTRHNDDLTSGRVVVDKFNFNGGSPSFVNETIVYQWMDADAAYTPYVAIDTNLATFSDVDSGGVTRTQTDPHVSTQTSAATTAVYVAFATAADTNPTTSAIKLVGSGDGGGDWSAPLLVSDERGRTTYGPGGASAPKILFTQGKAGVTGGNMVTVFSRDKQAIADSFPLRANAVHTVTQRAGSRLLRDADPGAATADPHIPRTTDIAIPIAVGASFGAITDVQLTLALSHAEVKELRAVLEAPDGTQFELFANGTDAANTATGQGIAGVDLGVLGNGFAFGATFDSRAPRRITDVVAPYVGNFRPENTFTIGGWNRFDGLAANGTWTLHITDFRNGNQGTLRFASLKITGNLNDNAFGSDNTIGLPTLVSSADPAVAPTQSGFTIAADQTLGAYSPFENRIYAAASLPGPLSRPDNFDVGFSFSDDNGVTWSRVKSINDDFAGDGFSEGRRGQFLPALAVDQATGTLAVTYYDYRFDAARARAATMFTTSLDGGDTFAKAVYLNPTEQAFDETRTKIVNLEPVTTNTLLDVIGTVDYARSTGLAVSRGRVTAVYAGNLNTIGSQLRTQELTIAAGPRIVAADMGPVVVDTTVDDDFAPGFKTTFNNLFGADGRRLFNGFVVTFDRFVDPSSFDTTKVAIVYRAPTDPPVGPGTPVTATAVRPLDSSRFGSKRFLVSVAPQSGIGTYSYTIGSAIFDRIRQVQPTITVSGAPLTFASPDVPKTIPDLTTIASTLNIPVGTFLAGATVAKLKVTVNITHTFDGDLKLTLISPSGSRVILSNGHGGGGDNYTNTVFDDTSSTPISFGSAPFTGVFSPDEALSLLNGADPIGDWQLEVADQARVDTGVLTSWSLTVTPGIVVVGMAPGNAMDQNSNAAPNEGAADRFAAPTPVNGLPFVLPYLKDTLPIVVPGPHVDATAVQGRPASPDNLVLNATANSIDLKFDRLIVTNSFTTADIVQIIGPLGPILGTATEPVSIVPIAALGGAEAPALLTSQFFRVTFPTQRLSGTYRIQLGPNITDTDGNKIDANFNAGVDALRGESLGGVKSTVAATTGPTAVALPAGKTTRVSLAVTDPFVIQKVTATLTLTHPDVSQLDVRLEAPDGTSVLLFNRIGNNGATHSNLNNTTFDDAAGTPIQAGLAPFANASFNPQQPLAQMIGRAANGTFTLVITNNGTTDGTLSLFSLGLGKSIPNTGLGETVADQTSVSLRIFQADAANPQSKTTWTPIGPAGVGTDNTAGRIGAIAVDPSDPSGNTVFTAGVSGGVWRTTNFLTRNPIGPTWIPLTDFGPTTAINIGALAVFNNTGDPTKSIVIAGSGEDSTNALGGGERTDGVGFLISLNGGNTWRVLDSTVNNDPTTHAALPITSSLRNHQFVGGVVNKIVIDPVASAITSKPTIYAASGRGRGAADATGPGGLWRSDDLGETWTRANTVANGAPLADYSDIVLAGASADRSTGQPQILYAAAQGVGVFRTVNRGSAWTLMGGKVGKPLLRDGDFARGPAITVTDPPSDPNGAKGRIALATPAISQSDLANTFFQGWLYAAVSGNDGQLDGLYVTKDFGDNWTKVRLAAVAPPPGFLPSIPTNDTSAFNPDVNATNRHANESLTLALDPFNPEIVYVGTATILRVDTAAIHDPHNLSMYSAHKPDAGNTRPLTTGNVGIKIREGTIGFSPPGLEGLDANFRSRQNPSTGSYESALRGNPSLDPARRNWNFVNLIRDPDEPFPGATNATLFTDNTQVIKNTGEDVFWRFQKTHRSKIDPSITLPESVTDASAINRMLTVIDPLTGRGRIIFGDDTGIHTFVPTEDAGLDNGTSFAPQIDGARNGNLQIARFYSGAVQPSVLAAEIGQSLFLGAARNVDDALKSPATELITGDVLWNPDARGGPAVWVETDPTGTGTIYQLKLPESNDIPTDFFQVTIPGGASVGRTNGLLQAGDDPAAIPAVGQWTDAVKKFAVNPVDPNGIAISSVAGRVFRTVNQGLNWFAIGEPAALDGTYAPAIAYGAPLPGGGGALNEFIYAGTVGGKVFVTTNGGGTWKNISTGLDGAEIQKIVTNPRRGSRELYAVTKTGVFRMADSGATAPVWRNVTGNLFSITAQAFGDPNWVTPVLQKLSTIAVDWRPLFAAVPSSPVLYAGGDGGVFRSTDLGVTWIRFPAAATTGTAGTGTTGTGTTGTGTTGTGSTPPINGGGTGTTSGAGTTGATGTVAASLAGGAMPVVNVIDLDLAFGNIQPATGLPDPAGATNVLLATTLGRGSFIINVGSPAGISGPRVVSQTPNSVIVGAPATAAGQLAQFDLTFSGVINPSSFTAADISSVITPYGTITDPVGVLNLQVTDITVPAPGQANRHNVWRVTLNPQLVDGTYKFIVGPKIFDFGGNAMNQDGDLINGEAVQDRYVATFTIADNDVADFIKDAYRTAIGRDPTTAEFAAWDAPLETSRFAGLNTFTRQLLMTAEARGRLVTRLFSIPGGAPATEVGNLASAYFTGLTPAAQTILVDGYVNRLRLGTSSPETIITDILTNPVFGYRGALSANAYVQKVYADLLGRPATLAEETTGAALVSTGSSGTLTFAKGVVNGTEFRNRLVTFAYQTYLGRVATLTELSAGRALLAQPLTANVLQGSEWLYLKIFAGVGLPGREYFNSKTQIGGLPDDGLHTNRSWLTGIFTDRLGGAPSLAELDTNSQTILNSYLAGRRNLANALVYGTPFRTAKANEFYALVFGATRVPSPAEKTAWLNGLASGLFLDNVAAVLFGKAEFFALAPSIIGDTINPPSNSTFVKAMYQVLLNRAPTAAELTTTLGRIAVRGRAGVALDLLRGNEYRLKVVKDAYLQYLGRTIIDADPEAVAGLALLRANRWEVLYSNLLVSRDFYEVNN